MSFVWKTDRSVASFNPREIMKCTTTSGSEIFKSLPESEKGLTAAARRFVLKGYAQDLGDGLHVSANPNRDSLSLSAGLEY